jgi:hypothetical protein
MKSPSIRKAVDKLPPIDQDCPSVVDSDVSSISSIPEAFSFEPVALAKREPLQWEFKGLTLWLEFEEFDGDLSRANEFISAKYGTEQIPLVHATAVYGMEHLDEKEAVERMSKIKRILPNGSWPVMNAPIAVKQDLSREGKPGQVCTISWAELTLRSNAHHEKAMDALCKLFDVERKGAWAPHISLAYDNPDDSILNLADIISYAMIMPTLLRNERRVKAISLWKTKGKMGEWACLDRVNLLETDSEVVKS